MAATEIAGMATAMAHRGPDSWGYAFLDSRRTGRDIVVAGDQPGPCDRDLALGHRRLAIIDLTPLGAQPMTFGPLTISYNGEIYNYIELAEELRSRGHRFVSRSDTEVLLHAWSEWGADCLARLNGIFAFLLWDATRRVLVAARDRFGVKPLYYCQDSGQIALASEIKALLSVRAMEASADEALIYDFLVAGRMDHEDATMFAGIKRLPGGCWMEITASGTQVRTYWAFPQGRIAAPDLAFEEASERFKELFHDSIRLQMRADVPVACCLSGGLDSSSVVSVASGLSPYRMSAFTARFEDSSMDEWSWAQTVHRERPVDPVACTARPEALWRELPALIQAQEEPVASPGVFAQWCVMKAIRERGIRVCLDGQGGDELLCGYAKYFYWALMELVREGRLFSAARSAFAILVRGEAHLFNLAGAKRYIPWGLGTRREKPPVLQRAFGESQRARDTMRPAGNTRAQQVLDIVRYSLPVLLRYEDRSSMAHSVEARVPFLDHRLVEFCVALPTEHKVKGSLSKRVLRQGLRDDVPRPILRRRSKLGFGGSFTSWVKALTPRLESWAEDDGRPVFHFARPAGVRRLIARRDPAVFRFLALDAWLQGFGIRP